MRITLNNKKNLLFVLASVFQGDWSRPCPLHPLCWNLHLCCLLCLRLSCCKSCARGGGLSFSVVHMDVYDNGTHNSMTLYWIFGWQWYYIHCNDTMVQCKAILLSISANKNPSGSHIVISHIVQLKKHWSKTCIRKRKHTVKKICNVKYVVNIYHMDLHNIVRDLLLF